MMTILCELASMRNVSTGKIVPVKQSINWKAAWCEAFRHRYMARWKTSESERQERDRMLIEDVTDPPVLKRICSVVQVLGTDGEACFCTDWGELSGTYVPDTCLLLRMGERTELLWAAAIVSKVSYSSRCLHFEMHEADRKKNSFSAGMAQFDVAGWRSNWAVPQCSPT